MRWGTTYDSKFSSTNTSGYNDFRKEITKIMASYGVNLTDDGAGNFTVTAFRAPTTAASGGTALTLPFVVEGGISPDTTKIPGVAYQTAWRAITNDRAKNG